MGEVACPFSEYAAVAHAKYSLFDLHDTLNEEIANARDGFGYDEV